MKKKKLSVGQRIMRSLLILIPSLVLLCLLGFFLIAEPWVSDQIEHTIAPISTDMGLIELELGDEYVFNIELGANEVISSIDSEHPTVIEPIGFGVRANGAKTEVNVTVTTREAVMSGRSRHLIFFGRDYSEPYYNLRRTLRSILGIQNAYTLPSELRVLNIYHYRFIVPEYPIEDAGQLHLRVNEYIDLSLKGLVDNVYTLLRVEDPSLLSYVQLVTDNDYRLFGEAGGKTELMVMYGFYTASTNQNTGKPNQFVPVKAYRYTVTIRG